MRERHIRDSMPKNDLLTTPLKSKYSAIMSYTQSHNTVSHHESTAFLTSQSISESTENLSPFHHNEVDREYMGRHSFEHIQEMKMKRKRSKFREDGDFEEEIVQAYERKKARHNSEIFTGNDQNLNSSFSSNCQTPSCNTPTDDLLTMKIGVEKKNNEMIPSGNESIDFQSTSTENDEGGRSCDSSKKDLDRDEEARKLLLNLAGIDTTNLLSRDGENIATSTSFLQPEYVTDADHEKQVESHKEKAGYFEKHKYVNFNQRLEQLKSFKAKHGHLRVTAKLDKNLYQYCNNLKYARRNPKGAIRMSISEERIKKLDEIGFNWENAMSTTAEGPRKPNGPCTSPSNSVSSLEKKFEARIDMLKKYKELHGHTRVKKEHNKSLHSFVMNVRSSNRRPGIGVKLTEERRQMLNNLGFEWDSVQRKSCDKIFVNFDERLEQLKAFKARHGHLNVTAKLDKHLHQYCSNVRYARRNPEAVVRMSISEERIKRLDEIGFPWESTTSEIRSNKSSYNADAKFESNVEQLRKYKEKNGHMRVRKTDDKSLYSFVMNVRSSNRNSGVGLKLTAERKKQLDDLGFDWRENVGNNRRHAISAKKINNPTPNTTLSTPDDVPSSQRSLAVRSYLSFEARVEQLKDFKMKFGHVRVTKAYDKGLYCFCTNIRSGRRNPGMGMKATDERIKILDALGFDWGDPYGRTGKSISSSPESSPHPVTDSAKIARFNSSSSKVQTDTTEQNNVMVLSPGNESNVTHTATKNDNRQIVVKQEEPIISKPDSNAGGNERETSEEEVMNVPPSQPAPLLKQRRVTVPFQERIQQLKAYKEKHGHLMVKGKKDKSLAIFCTNVRAVRRKPGIKIGIKLTEERIKSLDDIGFDWNPSKRYLHFEERLEHLKMFKERHGHLDVDPSDDKSLYWFCNNVREIRRNGNISEDRVAQLDRLGFKWNDSNVATDTYVPKAPIQVSNPVLDTKNGNDSHVATPVAVPQASDVTTDTYVPKAPIQDSNPILYTKNGNDSHVATPVAVSQASVQMSNPIHGTKNMNSSNATMTAAVREQDLFETNGSTERASAADLQSFHSNNDNESDVECISNSIERAALQIFQDHSLTQGAQENA